jgi:flagellar basal body-associated protein FliL
MKSTNILKFILLISFALGLEAQGFNTYKLFNNEFQAVFPDKPQELVPTNMNPESYLNKVQKFDMKIYQYGDNAKGLNFISQSSTSPLKLNIGEYNESTKGILDKSLIDALTSSGHTLISYSSTLNKKQNLYILIVKSSYYLEGVKRYVSTKHLLYKKRVYRWTVTHTNVKDKYIFDKYEAQCKILSSSQEINPKQYTAKIKDLVLNVTTAKGKEKLMGLSLVLVSKNPSIQALVLKNKAEIIDSIIHNISARNKEELLHPEGRMLLREELISNFNTILQNKKHKDTVVENIIFENYVITN